MLLFEGDRYRYVIPAASIVSCDLVEVSNTGTPAGHYAVVLVVKTARGAHELPLVALTGIPAKNRREMAVIFRTMIQIGLGLRTQQQQPASING